MEDKEIAKFCLETLQTTGAEKAQAIFAHSKKHELNVEAGEISLLRTTFNTDINLVAIKDMRKGSVTLNDCKKYEIKKSARNAIEISAGSEQDSAYDISEFQSPEIFDNGLETPDLDKMYYRVNQFLTDTKKLFPRIIFETLCLDFTRNSVYFLNSNKVDFVSSRGIYYFSAMFSAKFRKKSSSFNYSGLRMIDLREELLSMGTIKTLLQESSNQIETEGIREKFVGDIIVTPDCLGNFIQVICDWISDSSIISGTSVFLDKLGKKIADLRLTISSLPVSKEIPNGYYITADGFKAQNLTIIKKGILKSFLLGQYAAKKTGHKRVSNSGGCLVVDSGEPTLKEMVKRVKRGILLSRISGGHPNSNGDFSAVAKNSYYIESGEIKFPLCETMISANVPHMLNHIIDISKERINFGDSIFPWVSFSDVTISSGGT